MLRARRSASMATVAFSRCRSIRGPILALTPRASAPRSPVPFTAHCSPASIRRLPSSCRSPAYSATRCRLTPTAAPADRRRAMCSNGSRTRRRESCAWIGRRSAGAISFRRAPCPTRRRSGRPTTAAIFRKCSSARWRFPIMGRKENRAAASASRATLSPRALHRHASRA